MRFISRLSIIILLAVGSLQAQTKVNPVTGINWPSGCQLYNAATNTCVSAAGTITTPVTIPDGGTNGTTAAAGLANLHGISSVLTTPQTMVSPLALSNAGVFTNTQMNEYHQVLLNDCAVATQFQLSQGANYGTDALAGCVIVPSTATAQGVSAVSGYVENFASSAPGKPNAIGGFFQAACAANNSHCWGINPVLLDIGGVSNVILQNEFDFDVGGASTQVVGIAMNGSFNTAPAASYGFSITALTSHQWGYGFIANDACCSVGALYGTAYHGNTQASIPIQFKGVDSSGVPHLAQIFADALGDLILSPASGRPVFIGGDLENVNAVLLPSALTGTHGTSGTKVQLSDGTGTPGSAAIFASDGSITGGSGVSTTLTQVNLDDSLTTWKPVCVVGGCAGGTPGGTDTPTATVQSIGNASPALDGASMLLSLTTPVTSTQTNALWARNAPSCDTCTDITSDFEVYIGSNGAHASSFEFDSYEFDKTDLLNFMFGTQCNQTAGFWQIANQSSGWTSTTLACSLSYSTWHHIIENFTRDAASSTACSGMPCEHFVSISIDGTVTTLGLTEPSTVLPGTYASVIANQFQIDVGATTSAQTVTMNLDEVNFSASPTTAGQFLPLMGGTLTGALYGPSFNDLNLTGYGSTSNINLGGALNPAATGTNNIAAGGGSQNAVTTGYNLASFGEGTLYYCTTCYSSTAFGLNALQHATTGYELDGFGVGALNATTTGHDDDAQGHNALGQNIDGSSNVGIGAYAGWNSGTPLQHTNTSTFIGEGANNSVDGLANTTVIGYGAQGTASNQVTIGNAEVTSTILQGAVAAGTSVKTGVYTVSALPTGLPAGSIVAVSDATSLTAGACVGLGSTYTIAIYNGTTWACM